jgi:hypothetical protein
LIAQFPEALTLRDLALRFGQAGRGGKRFGDGFAMDLASQPIVRTMAGFPGVMAMAVWISTAPSGARDGPSAHVS